MTADNQIGTDALVSRAEEQMPLTSTDGKKVEPKATGPVIIGGESSKSFMSEAEKIQAQNEARQRIFRQ